MCIGGVGGLLFLVCFFVMYSEKVFLGHPMFELLQDFVSCVSLPVLALPGNKTSFAYITLDIAFFIMYWVILGMGVSFGLVWLYFFISRKRRQ